VGVELPEEDLQTAVNIELEQAKENLNIGILPRLLINKRFKIQKKRLPYNCWQIWQHLLLLPIKLSFL
jgi:hypothetical protein